MKTKSQSAALPGASLLIGLALAMSTLAFAAGNTVGGQSRANLGRSLHSVPLSSALDAFRSTREAKDVLPPNAARGVEYAFVDETGTVPQELLPGRQLVGDSRRLLSNLGADQGALFAWPTDKGWVCYLLIEMMGCVERLTVAQPVSMTFGDSDGLGSGSPGMVAGLVTNGVIGVDVIVNGVPRKARLANNAYFYELDPGIRSPDALVIHYRDGKTRQLVIPMPPSEVR